MSDTNLEPRGTCGSWCNGCDECQPEQATEPRCLPDCEGDCPVCLPPEEYDKLHGTTTNLAPGYQSEMERVAYADGIADERARIERIIEAMATKAGLTTASAVCADLLAAIRGGEDA